MANPTLFPVRTSSLPLIIIFLLLDSLLNHLHSSSYQSEENDGEPEKKGGLGKLLEPKFALHKWAHGYTCSYRDPRPVCADYLVRPHLWQCVGRTRTWGLVLVDFRPASWRASTALKLAKNAELVVLRGGQPGGVGTWPEDWLKSRQSSHPTIAGRQVIVDRKSTEWTLMIQGDLDRNGSAFATAINMLSQNQASPNILLTVAALATQGDILELGTGVF